MRLSTKRKNLLRNFEEAIFYKDKDYSYQDRSYSFYLLLRPVLEFLKVRLEGSLESPEVESELYLMCIDVFNNHKVEKASIVPYIERCLPWYMSKLIKKHKGQNNLIDMAGLEEEYILNEEFYWKNILLHDMYVGKCFTRSEKYLIYNIIESDSEDLSVCSLAKLFGVNRATMKNLLSNLKEVFQLEEINVRTN